MIKDLLIEPSGTELSERYRGDIQNSYNRLQENYDNLNYSHKKGYINDEVYLKRKNYHENLYKIEINNFQRLNSGEISIYRLVGEYFNNIINNSPAYNAPSEGLIQTGHKLGENLEILSEGVIKQINDMPYPPMYQDALKSNMGPELRETPSNMGDAHLNSDDDAGIINLENLENMQERAVVLYNKK